MKRLWMVLVLLGLASGAWAQQRIGYTPSPGPIRTIRDVSMTTPTSGTVEEVLYSLVIPANTWDKIGAAVRIRATFGITNNANTKTPRIRSGAGTGGTSIAAFNTSVVAGTWVDTKCVRFASGSMLCFGHDPGAGAALAANVTGLNFATDLTFSINGTTGTAAGELTLLNVVATKID